VPDQPTRIDPGFRAIVDRDPSAVLVEQEGRVQYLNGAFAMLLGYEDSASLVGIPIAELEKKHLCTSGATSPRLFTQQTSTRELRLKRRDGALVVAECHNELIAVEGRPASVLFVRDMTEPARMLEALRRSEQNLRALLEASPNATCVSSAEHIEYANAAMVEYLGYDAQDSLVRPTLAELSDEVIHPGDRVRTRDAYRQLFADLGRDASGKPSRVVRIEEIRVRRKRDGALRVCDMYGVIVLQNGAPALVTYLHDRTEQKITEERMRLADRMSSLGTLAAGVAHEINNPLAYVIANMEFIAKRLDVLREEDLVGPISAVRVGLERIRRIVQGLKTFSRRDEETIGPVDVVGVIESCVDIAQSQLRHTCRVIRDYTDVPPARGNDARLGQVFLNLLVNASQSFDEHRRDRNEITVRVTEAAERIVVEVRDNGCGIPSVDLPRVFDPFFTSKPIGSGTGLGLSVCHGIVTALGGEITIASSVGEGTTVRVALDRATGGATGRSKQALPKGRRGRVLVVDDDTLLLDAVKRILLEDHEVVTVPTAREAMRRLEVGENYDVVLCDVMMPGMSGLELYAQIASTMPKVAERFVFFTAGAVTERTGSLLEGTANAVLRKPFDPRELLRFVRNRVGA
jgi:PAS domain S-box-containing protein